jgi:LacI family transcriptional regulator
MSRETRIQPVTLADVAEAAGVARSTVSKAFHGYSSVSEKTRHHILETAERLGYRPNPLVQTLMAQLHTRRRRQDMTPLIAVVHAWEESWGQKPVYADFARGARARAQELGFKLEEFSIHKEAGSLERMAQILRNRGVQGVLLAQAPADFQELDLPIENFSCATLGPSLRRPRINRAGPDHFKAMRLALENCRRLGYQRPGFAVSEVADRRLHGIWRGAFLGRVQDLYPGQPAVPVHRNREDDPRGFHQWLRQHAPDVIITHGLEARRWTREAGIAIPRELGLAGLGVSGDQDEFAGVDLQTSLAGGEALNLIVNQMHLNQRGIPANRITVLVEPRWVAGRTLPPRQSP